MEIWQKNQFLSPLKGERGDGGERLTPPEFLVLSKKEIQSLCELLSVFLCYRLEKLTPDCCCYFLPRVK